MPAMAAIGTFLGASAGTAAAVGTTATLGAAGIGASIYGANKAAKSAQAVADKNVAAQQNADQLAYRRWLETQGVGDNGQAINTWLPRYATVSQGFGQPRRFRRAGSAPSAMPAVNGGGGYGNSEGGYIPPSNLPSYAGGNLMSVYATPRVNTF